MRPLNTLTAALASALVVSPVVFGVDVAFLHRAEQGGHLTSTLCVLFGLHIGFSAVMGLVLGGLFVLLGGRADDGLTWAREHLFPIRALRARRAAQVLIWPLAGAVTFLVLATLARRFFGFNNPRLAAYVLAGLMLLVVFGAVLVGGRLAAFTERLIRALVARVEWIPDDPAVWALLPAGLASGGLFAVLLGDTTALVETAGALPLGVLLAAPAILIAAGGLEVLARRRKRSSWLYVGGGSLVAAAPISLAVGLGAFTGTENGWVHERAPVGGVLLGAAERLTDRDKDGFSGLFGHGDCDDRDARSFPGSEEGDDCMPDAPLEDAAAFRARLHGPSVAPDLPPDLARPRKTELKPTMPVAADPVTPVKPGGLALMPEPLPSAPETPPDEAPIPRDRMHLARPYNVILVTMDTIRADHVGHLGYHRPTTDNLDALARESLVFERAYSPSNMTPISMGALLSGRYTSELFRDDSHFIKFDARNEFLAERLTAGQRLTSAITTHWYFEKKKKSGLDQGFARWQVVGTRWGKEMEDASTSEAVADAAIAELGQMPTDTPWFLWVHFLDPHKWYVMHDDFKEKSWGTGNMARYDHEIAFTDHHLGRLLKALAGSGHAARTAVIATSDHGEAFGEHGTVFHGFSVYEDQLRVPLVVRVPGVTDGGRRLRKRVSAIDIPPTILDLMGLPPVDALQGRSWGPELLGEDSPQRLIFAERVRGPHSAGFRALIDGDWKLVWRASGNRFELYDLERDPGELRDVMLTETTAASKMMSAMASMLEYGLDNKDKVRAGKAE